MGPEAGLLPARHPNPSHGVPIIIEPVLPGPVAHALGRGASQGVVPYPHPSFSNRFSSRPFRSMGPRGVSPGPHVTAQATPASTAMTAILMGLGLTHPTSNSPIK